MNTIWKYIVKTGTTQLTIPKNAVFLYLTMQHNEMTLWFQVNDLLEKEIRTFQTVETGGRISTDYKYLGTFNLRESWVEGHSYVLHLYERIKS